MPTPAKLVAALLFAGLCWAVGEAVVRQALEPGTRVGWLREAMAAGGLLVGWRVIGRAATGPRGRGDRPVVSLTAGIAAAFVFTVLALLLHSFGAMILASLGGGYTSVGRAATAWMRFLVEDATTVADPVVLGLMFGGGAAVGLVAGLVGRRWS